MDRDMVVGRVEAVVAPLVDRAGLELFAVQYRSEHGRMVLRLVVDRPEGGVTLDALAQLSRQIGHALEATDAVPGRYELECTSPGVERPLLQPRHFAQVVGQRVRLQTTEDFPARRRLRGTVTGADDETVTVLDDEIGAQRVPFAAIVEARTEFDATQALAARARR